MKRHRKSFHEFGQAHELTFSCFRRFPFLKAERTCLWLKQAIDTARHRESFDVWAYVFMPDHVHLLVRPRMKEVDIGPLLKAIKAPVARSAIQYIRQSSPEWLPKLARKRGDKTEYLFWQSGGGYDRNVTKSEALFAMIDYIHANPVRKGLVQSPRDWKWSSAAWFDNQSPVPIAVDPISKDWFQ